MCPFIKYIILCGRVFQSMDEVDLDKIKEINDMRITILQDKTESKNILKVCFFFFPSGGWQDVCNDEISRKRYHN